MGFKGLETVTFSTTRFFSSCFDQWKKNYESYKALIETYKRCRQDNEDETKYRNNLPTGKKFFFTRGRNSRVLQIKKCCKEACHIGRRSNTFRSITGTNTFVKIIVGIESDPVLYSTNRDVKGKKNEVYMLRAILSASLSQLSKPRVSFTSSDVGEIGHSRKQFSAILRAAEVWCDKRVAEFLFSSLPSTKLPPHYYSTSDKSTPNIISNQAISVCPFVNNRRLTIAVSSPEV